MIGGALASPPAPDDPSSFKLEISWKENRLRYCCFLNVFVFYLEDMCKGLVLGPPVKEVVPVVTSSQLLFAVHDAGGDGIV